MKKTKGIKTMTTEEKTIEYIKWFKDNSTQKCFEKSVMLLASSIGSLFYDKNDKCPYIF